MRPPAHEAAGIALASAIQPLDASGNPSPTGKIGFASIGMSNTVHEFGTFMSRVALDPAVNDNLVLVNGAAGGGVVESWTDTTNASQYQTYWDWFNSKIATAHLTQAQIQVVWAELTSIALNTRPFPERAYTLEDRILLLMMELRRRLPNLKIVYMSTRTRSFIYFPGEPVGIEQGFSVKWLIERQINRDPALNFDPALGPAPVPYLSWGPYLWIDGLNPRSDGRIWPLSYTASDCLHPSTEGYGVVADMLMQFFKYDTTTASWFLDGGSPPPPPPPPPPPDTTPPAIAAVTASNVGSSSVTINWTTDEPATGQVEFVDRCPSSGCLTPLVTVLSTSHAVTVANLAPATTYGYRVRSADSVGNGAVSDPQSFTTAAVPPPPTAGAAISSWGFATATVTDDVNGCNGCVNAGATWTGAGVVSGAFQLSGASYLNLGTFPHLNNRQAFTLSVWLRPGFDAASTPMYAVFADGANINVFHLDRTRPWRVAVRTTIGTFRVDASAIAWTAGTWHQLAVTYSGSLVKLYWDGVAVGSAAASGAVASDSGETYLGANAARGNLFIGDLDELRVYDYSLTDAQVQASYLDPAR